MSTKAIAAKRRAMSGVLSPFGGLLGIRTKDLLNRRYVHYDGLDCIGLVPGAHAPREPMAMAMARLRLQEGQQHDKRQSKTLRCSKCDRGSLGPLPGARRRMGA